MNDDLSDAITDAINNMAEVALSFTDTEDYKNAAAILNEWTTSSGQCVLTHHYMDTVEDIKDLQMYAFLHEGQFGYGTFSYDPEAELPADKN